MEINNFFFIVGWRLFTKDASIVLNFFFDSIIVATWLLCTTDIGTFYNVVVVTETAFWIGEYLSVVFEKFCTYDNFC